MFDGDELELALGGIANGLFNTNTITENNGDGGGDEGDAMSHNATTSTATATLTGAMTTSTKSGLSGMNATTVLRYLVQLVCQTMTHLLHAEVPPPLLPPPIPSLPPPQLGILRHLLDLCA